ncbi:hypothetical protein LZ24_02057 [Desulfobotulus alkaliphilus]|uniref:Uncharacterized protein n=1 Tax=Desulfobotulus alkaliphilus TaxID=622671 RepID=A0A562RS45_9BACT|nr:hypothetical protein [Desulfobotulus alkaliphilus]TWI71096.1 hypothetical protein LZ24_02057 [Desulfobotulus alkaliphilus]
MVIDNRLAVGCIFEWRRLKKQENLKEQERAMGKGLFSCSCSLHKKSLNKKDCRKIKHAAKT